MPRIPESFEKYVFPVTESGCWIWMGYLSEGGYGRYCPEWKTSPLYAHRVSYEIFKGPIPTWMCLDHLCRVRCCCNPDHLEVVTQAENVLRGNAGANHRNKTHCKHGHEFSPENTAIRTKPNGAVFRVCRMCDRLNGQKKYAKKMGRL